MSNKNTNTPLTKTSAFKRSIILLLLGIPMMYIASCSQDSVVCLIISAIYILLLLINGISCLPLTIDIIKKAKYNSKLSCNEKKDENNW